MGSGKPRRQRNDLIATRLRRFESSITMAITAEAAARAASGQDIISLSAGEPDFDAASHIKDAVRQALTSKDVSKYTDVRGTVELRSAIAHELSAVHQTCYEVDNIIVSSGAKHSLYTVLACLLNPRDEVLIPTPCWGSYPEMVKLLSGVPVFVEANPEDGFVVSPAALRRAISPRTRCLILNSPCNPTGAILDAATLYAIAELVVEHDLNVVADDIYRSLTFDDDVYVSIASLGRDIAERTIICDGVSKSYAMTGWRIGYTAATADIIEAMAKLQSQMTSNPAHVAQVAALAALSGPQDHIESMRVALAERRRGALARLECIPGISCVPPRGAFYLFPDMRSLMGAVTPTGETLTSDIDFCRFLLSSAGVAVVPGTGFCAPGYFRISFACATDRLYQGIERIKNAIGKLRLP